MPVTTQNNLFTTTTTSEPASPLVAGVVSFTGLVPLFGTTGSNGTSEVETGIMTVPNVNDWVSRLNSSSAGAAGPTGGWADEWWSVYNYLQYGGSCIVGGTGSTGDYYFSNGVLGVTNTPIHNKSYAAIDVIFETGNTFSAGAAVNAATSRGDCIAIVGNYKRLTGLPLGSSYTNQFSDFGVTSSSEYVVFVAGRKKYTAGVGNDVIIKESNLSADVAGCFARSARDASIWSSPAGKTRGRILGVMALQQSFNDSDSSYLISGKVNPVMVFPGEGTYLMGNKTAYSGTASLDSINVASLTAYLKRELLKISRNLLFEINDSVTRQKFIGQAIPVLDKVIAGNGITDYRIVCDETNNTPAIVQQNKLVADVYIKPTFAADTIVINIVNTNTSQAF